MVAALLKGSLFEPLTGIVCEMVSLFIPRTAIHFYCGADSGVRPGKTIVLSIFNAIQDFFLEFEASMKSKKLEEDVLMFMLKNRKQPMVEPAVTVGELLDWAKVPLTAQTAVDFITFWFCDPVIMARTFDRMLQFPSRVVEPTTLEPTEEAGAAKLGKVDVETEVSDFGSAIESAIHSVLKAGGVNKVVRALEKIVLFCGVEKLIGKQLDASLDPTIDVHIMNVDLLRKVLTGPQSEGMPGPGDVACVDFFYKTTLGRFLDEYVPKLAHGVARKAIASVAVVTGRSDLLKDLVFQFVLPNLIQALKTL